MTNLNGKFRGQMLPTLMFLSTNLPWLHGRQFSYQNYTKVNTRHGCLLQCLPGEKQPSVSLRVTQSHHSKSCFPDTLQISVLLSSFQWWKYQKLGVFSDKTWKKKILLHCTDKFASLLIFCLLTWVGQIGSKFFYIHPGTFKSPNASYCLLVH